MTNQVSQNGLIERIGIDKSMITGFSLLNIDDDLFNAKKNEVKGTMYFTPNEYSGITLRDGRKIGELKIDTKEIGNLHIKSTVDAMTGEIREIATLNVFTNDSRNNFQNMNCTDYQKRIVKIFNKLRDEYGVDCYAEIRNLRIIMIEFNVTFWLNHKYQEYGQCLSLMEKILPERYATGTKDHRRVKTGNYESNYVRNFAKKTYQDYLQDKEREPLSKKETIYCGNNKSTQVKIYHKNQQLKDVKAMEEKDEPMRDAMRIEYTIKDNRILKSKRNFNGDRVIFLTDDKLKEFFKRNFKRDFVDQYRGWKKWNHQELLERIDFHKKNCNKWVTNFVRDSRRYAQMQNGTPLLFDIEDVRDVLKELESNPKKGNRKYIKFRKCLNYETDLIGNNKKIQEILTKVMNM